MFDPNIILSSSSVLQIIWSIKILFYVFLRIFAVNWVCNLRNLLIFTCMFRYDKPRGDQSSRERLSNAASGVLPSRALWHHAWMLEEQARRQTHLWVPTERTGGLLYCHWEPISAAALIHTHLKMCMPSTRSLQIYLCHHNDFIYVVILLIVLFKWSLK